MILFGQESNFLLVAATALFSLLLYLSLYGWGQSRNFSRELSSVEMCFFTGKVINLPLVMFFRQLQFNSSTFRRITSVKLLSSPCQTHSLILHRKPLLSLLDTQIFEMKNILKHSVVMLDGL